jgi:hypothetical protein
MEGITFCIRVTPIHPLFLPSLAHRRRCPALPSHSLQQIFIPFTSLLLLKYQSIPIHTKDYSSFSYSPFILPCKDQHHSLQRPSSHNRQSGPTQRPLPFHTYIQPCTLISSSENFIPSSHSKYDLKPCRKSPHLKCLIYLFIYYSTRFSNYIIRSQFPDELITSLT